MSADERPFWAQPAIYISVLLLLIPYALAFDFFFLHPDRYDPPMQTQIVTAILMVLSNVAGFWLGTSVGSQRKTELLKQPPPTNPPA